VSQQINLFNPIFLKQKKIFSAFAMAYALGVLLAGALTVALYARHNVDALQTEAKNGHDLLAQREASLTKVKAEFAPRQKSAELEAELAQAETRLKAMHSVAGVLERGELGDTKGYSEYFKALARQNPSGVWLTGVTISGAGNELGVQGRALDAALVPAYLGRLTHEPVMRGKAFGSLRIGQPAADKDAAATAAPFIEFSLDSTLAESAK
jgi:Tfp pilus assembly protein PilN